MPSGAVQSRCPQAHVVIPMLNITIADVPWGEILNLGCVHKVVLLLYTWATISGGLAH
jgi:hypothetical protein